MRKILFGVVIALIILFTFKYCGDQNNTKISIQENSALIQEQINNVGKLVVTEGHFSEVITYQQSKSMFNNWYNPNKKAVVIVNADVTVAYDLSKIEFDIDSESKVLRIKNIPKEEIKISPELEYYDMDSDFLNPFEPEDYNKIAETVKSSIAKKVEQSDLKSNAENRLISELSKFFILTNSLGWELQYNQSPISNIEQFKSIDFKL
ncbi:MAG: DUF4230 domain-containing protein [Winogradskyella sp.]|uniref:DUF4230 domain-containing protein n=1 Tax=Winogradskyella sp. TaxID=1883156 RepID=UPI0025EA6B3E|nr:DUF4230 domain-containing protein [Winogradskyella sp.]NRB60857.1 DUF4230 domain-containing protein [Winogradskyella sp.]